MSNHEDDDMDLLAPGPWTTDDTVTVLVGGATANFGTPGFGATVYRRGDVIRVTPATLEAQSALLALVGDVDAQLRRWGVQKFARGTVDLERWSEKGSAEWIIARDAARQVAAATVDPVERAQRYADIQQRFGSAPAPKATQYRDLAAERRAADDEHARSQRPRGVILSKAD
ncbi:MAG: hypothetical protein CMH36_06405 [Microbacterium sp.]|jgi:hypothetical protein|uniref:Uncharacterized protein n=1 Tax=Microbacterium ginsengisoli TaxID=400772 RepID=A0A0F0LYI0_9MICO|nr:hypothetical protein [Microbacterium ginsengisoli]KJL39005.1 hypothetical protein RR49_00578 [Microbacterium ginsengisoli]MAL06443.1 hypothetical protein [Microbacterium sp.]MBN9209761.1 hypothetical protein [Microbacterium ginsengisoli]HAN25222.1 hypothetical protein [Microbacterium ginsengisoli]